MPRRKPRDPCRTAHPIRFDGPFLRSSIGDRPTRTSPDDHDRGISMCRHMLGDAPLQETGDGTETPRTDDDGVEPPSSAIRSIVGAVAPAGSSSSAVMPCSARSCLASWSSWAWSGRSSHGSMGMRPGCMGTTLTTVTDASKSLGKLDPRVQRPTRGVAAVVRDQDPLHLLAPFDIAGASAPSRRLSVSSIRQPCPRNDGHQSRRTGPSDLPTGDRSRRQPPACDKEPVGPVLRAASPCRAAPGRAHAKGRQLQRSPRPRGGRNEWQR